MKTLPPILCVTDIAPAGRLRRQITGEHPTAYTEVEKAVEHAAAFYKQQVGVLVLGEGMPPIVVSQGKKRHYIASEQRYREDDDSIHYTVNCYGYGTLPGAILHALGAAHLKNGNAASAFAEFAQKMLAAGVQKTL